MMCCDGAPPRQSQPPPSTRHSLCPRATSPPSATSPSTCHISVHVSQVKTIEEEFWSIVNESEKEEGADGGAKEQNGFH